MSIRSPIIASAAGCLDSSGLVDGLSLNAHHLRTLASQANRLLAKGQAGPCVSWPEAGLVSEIGSLAHEAVVGADWQRVWAPIPWMKMPGGGRADMRIWITSNSALEVSVTSMVQPTPGQPDNTASIAAGSMAAHSLDSFPISTGVEELLQVYLRGPGATSTLGETATYGSPNSSSNGPDGASPTTTWAVSQLNRLEVGEGTPSWVIDGGGLPTWSTTQHSLVFLDTAGNELIGARRITEVVAANVLHFMPVLSPEDYQRVMGLAAGWEIRQPPSYQLGSVSFRQRGWNE